MDEEFVENILDELEIPLNLEGYKYLVDAILIKNKKNVGTCELYSEIARKYEVKPTSVERNIRTVKDKCGTEIGRKLFIGYKMNNSVLLEAIYRYAKREYNRD